MGGYGTDMGGIRSNITTSEYSALSKQHPHKSGGKAEAERITAMFKDMIYSTKQNLYELFKTGMTGNSCDLEGFEAIINEVSGGCVPQCDIELCFKYLPKNRNAKLSFQTFEETFRSEIPSGMEFETKVIRKLREWMYQNNLSSELAFDALCRATGRFVEKSLSRAAFHKAMSHCEVGLPAV